MKYILSTILSLLLYCCAWSQYCTPSYYFYGLNSGALRALHINGFSGTAIHDTLPASSLTSGYADRVTAIPPITLQQGRSYNCSIIYHAPAAGTANQFWIDFNNDTYFENEEAVSAVWPAAYDFASSYSTLTIPIFIPATATIGNYRLRLRNVAYHLGFANGFGSTYLHSCNNNDTDNHYYSGITADYSVNITTALACSGMPVAGNVAGPSSICRNTTFALQASNDTLAGNLTYQWYVRPTSSGAFTAITGATNSWVIIPSQNTAATYTYVLRCPASGLQDSATALTVALTSPTLCLCNASLGGDTTQTTLDSVSITGTTLNTVLPRNNRTYTSFADTGASRAFLLRSGTNHLFIKTGGISDYAAMAWIDYDHSGTFDSLEHIAITSFTSARNSCFASIVVPALADTGIAKLRIRVVPTTAALSATEACSYRPTGQTMDFNIHINDPVLCAARPSAGTLVTTDTLVCGSRPFTILSSGHSVLSNIRYQWYSSGSRTSGFTAIGGATNTLLTVTGIALTTYYRLESICTASGLRDTSNTIAIHLNPTYLCYCSPLTGTTLHSIATSNPIDSVTIIGTALNNPTIGRPSIYQRYFPTTATTTDTLRQGTYYDLVLQSSGSGNFNAGFWIDFNNNSTFEAVEFTSLGTNVAAGSTLRAAVFIPSSSTIGTTGLRVKTTSASTLLTATDACTNITFGSTADYIINIAAGRACSGTPHPGLSQTTADSVCAGSGFTLTNIGATNTLGISYQWLSRPSSSGSGGWTPISGATLISHNVGSQSVSTQYALKATCSFSGAIDTSNSVLVRQNQFYLCYCAPHTGIVLNDSALAAPIDSFSIGSTTLNYTSSGSGSGRRTFEFFNPPMPGTSTSLNLGGTYILAINSYGTGRYKAAAWLDRNRNGLFDDSEYHLITPTSVPTNTSSYSILTLPISADTGYTGLRIRTFASTDSISNTVDCSRFVEGATKDYLVELLGARICSGSPFAGSIQAFPATVCSGQSFRLISESYTAQQGITYQWLKAAAIGSRSFTALSGATNPTFVTSQSAATDYVLVARCTASGRTDTSGTVTVTLSPFYQCYCSPITNVTLNTYNNNVTADSVAITSTSLQNIVRNNPDIYKQYFPITTTTTASLARGITYRLGLKSGGGANYNAVAWIDFNKNGTFDSSEYTEIANNIPSGTSGTASIFIPYASDTGLTGLRIRYAAAAYYMGPTASCSQMTYGATQDYVIRLAPGTPCTGTPSGGIVRSSASGVCAGTGFTLTDSGFAVGVGISYQWYARPTGTTSFTAISGATTSRLNITSISTSTDYRYTASCSSSGLSGNSNIVTVVATPFYNCYCNAALGTSSTSTTINQVAIAGTTLRTTSTYSNVYKYFLAIGDSTATLQRTIPYTLSLRATGGGSYSAGLWIDYNHNSTFETSEFTLIDTVVASGTLINTTINAPATADTGLTGMRIRVANGIGTIGASNACTAIANSQTFDYTIRIDTLVNCSGRPTAGTISSTSSFACPSMSFTLSNTGYSIGARLTYQWYRKGLRSSTYTAISGATSHSHTITGQTDTTEYIRVVFCSVSALRDTSNVLRIVQYPFDSCYCSPTTGIRLVTNGSRRNINGVTIAGTSMYVPTQSPDASGYVAVPPTSTALTATLLLGSTYNTSVFVAYTTYTIADAGAWIDYNHNSIFDSTEYIRLNRSSDRSTWSANISIPTTALLGLTGFRVATSESGTITGSCNLIGTGQVQDHIITLALPPCYSVSSASITNITDSSATCSWSRIAGARGYQYVVDTFSTDPTGAIFATTDTFVQANCLINNRNYYLHVRDSCGLGYTSSWTTFAFRTLPCTGLTGMTISGVSATGATVTWSGVTGTTGYEYAYTTTATPPTSGTRITGLSTTLTALNPGTTYYLHLRSGCRCTNFSTWYTTSFTTLCDSTAGLTVSNITDTSVLIRWRRTLGASVYGYIVDTFSTTSSSTAPTTTDTFITVSGLRPGTNYWGHIRHNCSSSFSNWAHISFRTTRCDTVTGLTATGDDTSVTLGWTAVSGSSGYYYVVTNSATPPVGTGTFTTSTFGLVTPLVGGRTYYAHVRTNCSSGRSAWSNVAFNTLPCDTIHALTASGICDTTATFTWSTTTGVDQYVYILNTSPTPTGTANLIVGTNTITFSTLVPGTTYYFHIRHRCSAVDSSAWTTMRFTTAACLPVATFSTSLITSSSVVLNWTSATCLLGYEWVVDNFPTDPLDTGRFTTATSMTVSGLLPAVPYYAHVRIKCGGGRYSAWTTIPFTTLPCDPTSIIITDLDDTSARVRWRRVPGAAAYFFKIDNSPTTATGTYTVDTTTPAPLVTGLLPNTLYYAHIQVLCTGGLYSPWADTPFTTTSVGIEDINGNDGFVCRAYPNPITEMLTVHIENDGQQGTIYITDLTGKLLYQTPATNPKTEIDLHHLASGLYLIKYSSASHQKLLKLQKL